MHIVGQTVGTQVKLLGHNSSSMGDGFQTLAATQKHTTEDRGVVGGY